MLFFSESPVEIPEEREPGLLHCGGLGRADPRESRNPWGKACCAREAVPHAGVPQSSPDSWLWCLGFTGRPTLAGLWATRRLF